MLLMTLKVPADRGVVGQHVHDEALFYGLLHRVVVEGQVSYLSVRLWDRRSEQFQGLVLRGGGERQVGGVWQHPPALNDAVDLVFEGVLVLFFIHVPFAQGPVYGARCVTSLAGVCFVDDDGELTIPVVVTYVVHDEGELLDGCDDDFLPFFDEPA